MFLLKNAIFISISAVTVGLVSVLNTTPALAMSCTPDRLELASGDYPSYAQVIEGTDTIVLKTVNSISLIDMCKQETLYAIPNKMWSGASSVGVEKTGIGNKVAFHLRHSLQDQVQLATFSPDSFSFNFRDTGITDHTFDNFGTSGDLSVLVRMIKVWGGGEQYLEVAEFNKATNKYDNVKKKFQISKKATPPNYWDGYESDGVGLVSPDGLWAITLEGVLFNLQTEKRLKVGGKSWLNRIYYDRTGAQFSPDSKNLILISEYSDALKLFDVDSGSLLNEIKIAGGTKLNTPRIFHDKALVNIDGTIHVYDLKSSTLMKTLGSVKEVDSFSVSENGEVLKWGAGFLGGIYSNHRPFVSLESL